MRTHTSGVTCEPYGSLVLSAQCLWTQFCV